ncbi:MAG: hypothetical protein ACE5IG_02250 [Dehalococcoidia bacterium]
MGYIRPAKLPKRRISRRDYTQEDLHRRYQGALEGGGREERVGEGQRERAGFGELSVPRW